MKKKFERNMLPNIYSKSVILKKAFAEMGGVRVLTKNDVIGSCVTWLIADLIKQAQLFCCYRFKVIPSLSHLLPGNMVREVGKVRSHKRVIHPI